MISFWHSAFSFSPFETNYSSDFLQCRNLLDGFFKFSNRKRDSKLKWIDWIKWWISNIEQWTCHGVCELNCLPKFCWFIHQNDQIKKSLRHFGCLQCSDACIGKRIGPLFFSCAFTYSARSTELRFPFAYIELLFYWFKRKVNKWYFLFIKKK